MASEATLIVRLKAVGARMAAAALRAVGTAITRLATAATKATAPLRAVGTALSAATLRTAATAFKSIAAGLASITKAAAASAVALKAVGRAAQQGGERAEGATSNFRKLGRVLLNAFLIKGAVDLFVGQITRAIQAFFGLINSTTKVNIALTAADVKLRASTNGTQEYAEATSRLNRIVERLGLELLSSKEALSEFLASTRQSNLSLDERISIFESLSQAGRVFNLSSERIKLAFLAISQIASKGAASLEEVRRQLGDQIPGVVPLLAKALGITVPELFDRIKRKALSAEDALRALKTGLDELVGDQVFEASRLLIADLGRMQTELVRTKERFAEASEEGVQGFAQAITQMLKDTEALQSFLGKIASEDLDIFAGATRGISDFLLKIQFFREAGDNIVRAFVKARFAGQEFADVQRQVNAALKETFADVPETIDDVAARFRALGAGQIELAKGWVEIGKDADEARKRIEALAVGVEKGLISIGDAEAELKTIIITSEQAIQNQLERTTRTLVESVTAIEDAKRKQREAASSTAAEEAKAQKEIQEAILETGRTAESQARQREVVSADLVRFLVANEVNLGDDLDAALRDRTAGFQVGADERQDIEEDFSKAVEKISRDLNKKLFEIREEATEEAEKQGGITEKIATEQLDKEVELRRKANEKINALLEKTTEKFKDESEKRTRIAEREAKKQQEALRKAFDFEPEDATRTIGLVNDDAPPAGLEFLDELLKEPLAKLKQLQEEFLKLTRAGKSTTEITAAIIDLKNNMVNLAQEAAPAATAALEDFSGSSEKLRQIIRDMISGEGGFEGFRAAVAGLGTDGAESLQALIQTFNDLAVQQQASAADAEDFRARLVDIFRDGGTASQEFASNLEQAAGSSRGSTDAILKALQDMTAGLAPAGEAVGETADQIRILAGEAEGAAVRLAEVEKGADAARISISNTGEAAAAAGPGVQVLGVDSELTAEQISKLAESLGIGVIKSDGVAVSAEEAGGRIREMGEEAAEAGPALEILSTDSEHTAEKIRNLGEALGITVIESDSLKVAAEGAGGQIRDMAVAAGEAHVNIAEMGETIAETVPLVEPLVAPLQAIKTAVADLGAAALVLPAPLALVATDLARLVEDEILKKAGEGFQALADASKPLAERLPVIATETAAFLETAGKSEEPLDQLHEGLAKISSEELVARLFKMAESVGSIRKELERLAAEGQGFDKATQAAEDFQVELDETLVAMEDFLGVLRADFRPAIQDHAGDWDEVREKVREYRIELDGLADDTFPKVVEATNASMSTVDKRVDASIAKVRQLNLELQKALEATKELAGG